MKIKRRHFSKALKDPLWALDAVYRRISRRNREKSKSRFPRVALGANGSAFLQILLQEMKEDGIRFFKGCARDEWAGGINILASDVRILTELIEKASKDTNIEFHINRRNKIFSKSSDFNKTLDSDDALYFSILVTEKTNIDNNALIRYCSYIDIHSWRSEESYQPNRNYRSSSTAPFVSRLRKETIDHLLDTHADLDSERKEIVYTSRFPIDVVYTWVDDGDPNWLSQKEHYSGKSQKSTRSDHPERFRNRDELKYSLRSLELYAPFVRNIYIVTADQAPDWLDIHHPQIKLISHSQIYRSSKDLPTFNSSSIETQLHHIEGLSEHFLYFNDDFMLGAFCTPDDFFLPNGSIKFFPSEQVAYEPDIDDSHEAYIIADSNVIRMMKKDRGKFGRAIMKHVPYPCRKSYLEKLERQNQFEFDTCASNRFRSNSDIRPIAFMQYQYGFLDGLAHPAEISHRYLALWKENIGTQFATALRRRSFKTLCINDVGVPNQRANEVDDLVGDFLKRYFPFESRFEKTEEAMNTKNVRPAAACAHSIS